MDIREQFVIEVPADEAWKALREPNIVAACFPGAELTEQIDNETYRGLLRVRFGPTTATFRGQATIAIDDAARTGNIEARGRDSRGSSAAVARATVVVAADEHRSHVAVTGSIDVSGPLGGFAASGGIQVAQVLFREFGDNIAERVRLAASDSTERVTDLSKDATGRALPGFMLVGVVLRSTVKRWARTCADFLRRTVKRT